jgi:hypothetical protein
VVSNDQIEANLLPIDQLSVKGAAVDEGGDLLVEEYVASGLFDHLVGGLAAISRQGEAPSAMAR